MTTSYPSLDGKVVLVTGAGKGIGRAIAERFAGQNCKLVINDIDEANVASMKPTSPKSSRQSPPLAARPWQRSLTCRTPSRSAP